MEQLGGIFYINLDRRVDRRTEIESEFARMSISGERFVGIVGTPGIVGCGKSHLAILKIARDRGLRNVLIFEDDFQFIISKEELESMLSEFFYSSMPFDVLMLSYDMHKSQPIDDLVMKVDYATTASAYIVNSCFYDALIELYETNLPLLESTGKHWIYANDQIWRTLQPESRWFAFVKRVGIQRGSYSDNSLIYMDRNY